jgi:hypothetical protein
MSDMGYSPPLILPSEIIEQVKAKAVPLHTAEAQRGEEL